MFFLDASGVSGAEIVILRLLRRLDREQFHPLVFCDPNNEELISCLEQMDVPCWKSKAFLGLKRVDTTGIRLDKLLWRLRLVTRLTRDLISCIRLTKVRIIHANMYPGSLYCTPASMLTGVPLIWHDHTIRPIRWLNRLNYKFAGLGCASLIAVSDACKKNLVKAGIPEQKIATIYNGMDLQEFDVTINGDAVRDQYGIDKQNRVVGLFGQPLPEKGHTYFIEAASEVIRAIPNCTFLIVGYLYQTDYQRFLYSLVHERRLGRHVIFTGWREDIPNFMAAIDVMAHTRVTPEPAALVLMEAMAMGKPVVGTSTGGTPELVVNGVTGLLVPPADSTALALGIIELLKNPERAKQMGLNGRRRVETLFALDRQVHLIQELYQKLQ